MIREKMLLGLVLSQTVATQTAVPAAGLRGGRVAQIRASRTLRCAIDVATPEYSILDLHGPRTGFDLELCHAVAVAIAGDGAKVLPVPVPDEASAVAALLEGKADLAPTVSLDLTHGTMAGLQLGPPILLDGTGLLVPAGTGGVEALAGKKVCFFAETETELSVRTWFAGHHVPFTPYPFSEEGEMEAALTSGNCAAMAGDLTRLARTRDGIGGAAGRYKILAEVLAPDPLGPGAADAELARTATWVDQLLLEAARLGVGRENLAAMLKRDDAAEGRLLGRTHELGAALGLDDEWPVRVLRAVGNYAEMYERTLGRTLGPIRWPLALPLK